MKNPTLATVLNIVPGLGYVYIGGKKRTFGGLLLLSIAVTIISYFDPLLASQNEVYVSANFRIWDVLGILSFILPVAAFMYDAYISTLSHNLEVKKK